MKRKFLMRYDIRACLSLILLLALPAIGPPNRVRPSRLLTGLSGEDLP